MGGGWLHVLWRGGGIRANRGEWATYPGVWEVVVAGVEHAEERRFQHRGRRGAASSQRE